MKISFKLVLESDEGYYVGRLYYNEQRKGWIPYSRESQFFTEYDLADELLYDLFEDKDYELIERGNGTFELMLVWVHPDLQITGYLDTIAKYESRSEAYLHYHLDAKDYFAHRNYVKYYNPTL